MSIRLVSRGLYPVLPPHWLVLLEDPECMTRTSPQVLEGAATPKLDWEALPWTSGCAGVWLKFSKTNIERGSNCCPGVLKSVSKCRSGSDIQEVRVRKVLWKERVSPQHTCMHARMHAPTWLPFPDIWRCSLCQGQRLMEPEVTFIEKRLSGGCGGSYYLGRRGWEAANMRAAWATWWVGSQLEPYSEFQTSWATYSNHSKPWNQRPKQNKNSSGDSLLVRQGSKAACTAVMCS